MGMTGRRADLKGYRRDVQPDEKRKSLFLLLSLPFVELGPVV